MAQGCDGGEEDGPAWVKLWELMAGPTQRVFTRAASFAMSDATVAVEAAALTVTMKLTKKSVPANVLAFIRTLILDGPLSRKACDSRGAPKPVSMLKP